VLSSLYLFEAVTFGALVVVLEWHFSLPAVLVLVALDGTAALAASALLRAAAARCAREWAYPDQSDASGSPAGVGYGGVQTSAAGGDAREARALEAERAANAALNIGFAATFTLGPALAGLVVPAFGAPAALLIDAVSFVICAGMLLDLKPHVEDAEISSVRGRLAAAWQYVNEAPTLRRLLIAEGFALTFFTFSGPVEVAYAKASLHAGDAGYGLLVGVWGLGVAVGSVVFARSIERSLGVLLTAGTLAVGLAYLGWAAAPNLALACVAGLLGGVGNGVQWAALISAVQRLSPQRLHSRLMGAVESLGAICPAVGFSLGGAITMLSSPRGAFLVAGVGATVGTTPFLRIAIGAPGGSRRTAPDAGQQTAEVESKPPAGEAGDSHGADQAGLERFAAGRDREASGR
jgi:MFS family permease